MRDPGRLVPVCCSANITSKVMDHFIAVNQDYYDQAFCHLVFVDSVTKTYNDKLEIGMSRPSSTTSPFKGKTPQDCYQLLRQLCTETESDIDYTSFVIMDDRSIEDDTVLLVSAPREDWQGEILSVRAAFEVAYHRFLGYDMGYMSIEEDQALAEEAHDGVLRAQAIEDQIRQQEQACVLARENSCIEGEQADDEHYRRAPSHNERGIVTAAVVRLVSKLTNGRQRKCNQVRLQACRPSS